MCRLSKPSGAAVLLLVLSGWHKSSLSLSSRLSGAVGGSSLSGKSLASVWSQRLLSGWQKSSNLLSGRLSEAFGGSSLSGKSFAEVGLLSGWQKSSMLLSGRLSVAAGGSSLSDRVSIMVRVSLESGSVPLSIRLTCVVWQDPEATCWLFVRAENLPEFSVGWSLKVCRLSLLADAIVLLSVAVGSSGCSGCLGCPVGGCSWAPSLADFVVDSSVSGTAVGGSGCLCCLSGSAAMAVA